MKSKEPNLINCKEQKTQYEVILCHGEHGEWKEAIEASYSLGFKNGENHVWKIWLQKFFETRYNTNSHCEHDPHLHGRSSDLFWKWPDGFCRPMKSFLDESKLIELIWQKNQLNHQ